MNDILGWIGIPSDDPRSVIQTMVGQSVSEQTASISSAASVAIVNPTASSASFYAKDDVSVAATGQFRWDSADLAGPEPAQAIHKAYQAHDKNLGVSLKGHFKVAILDRSKNTLHLFVDRIGAAALRFYQHKNGGVVFASSVSAIQSHPSVCAEIDPQQILNYLYFHMVPGPNTVFSNIHKLEAGHQLSWQNHSISVSPYWQPDFTRASSYTAGDYDQTLKNTLSSCVKDAGEPDEKIGMFLSGGLDSSSVVGFASKHFPDAPALCIGFSEKGYDEMEFARHTAQHFGVDLHEYYVTPKDVADAVSDIASRYDEPFGNSSAIPTLFCARLAKQHGIKKMLAGDGGDELFAGNQRYATQLIFDIYSHVPSLFKPGLEAIFLNPLFRRTPLLRKAYRYIEQARVPMPERLETYNHVQTSKHTDLFTDAFLSVTDPDTPLSLLNHKFWDKRIVGDLVDRMLNLDWKFTLTDNDLRKVTHMCESEGIEVAYPMLDDRLIELSCQIPSNDKIKKSDLRHYYKRALSDFLPKKTLTKEKHGFGLPFGVWLKEASELKYLQNEVLDDFSARGILKKSYIDQLRKKHQNEHAAYYGDMIWVIVMLELWLRSHKLDVSFR